MSSIYRTSPSKRSKSGGCSGASAAGAGGGGGSPGGPWTYVGPEFKPGNANWPCPRKFCTGFIVAKTRKNSNSSYGVCDTRKTDDLETCQVFYNLNKRHWGSGENGRTCEWCEGDTGDSPSIGVPSESTNSSSTSWANYHVVWKDCLGARSQSKLKFARVVTKDSGVIGKVCEASFKDCQVGDNIAEKCTGKIAEGDLLLKKAGDYLLEEPPALHFHCAKREFDAELHRIIADKEECKALGTSASEEAKQACASIPADLADGF